MGCGKAGEQPEAFQGSFVTVVELAVAEDWIFLNLSRREEGLG